MPDATIDPLARLAHEIGLRIYADRFLDCAEEREVRVIAQRVGLSEADTDREIGRVCQEQKTLRETVFRQEISRLLQQEFGTSKIDEAGFHRVVARLTPVIPMTDREKQKLVLAVMDDTGRSNIKRGWFSNWHKTLKQSLGLPSL